MEFTFNVFNKLAADGVSLAVSKFLSAAQATTRTAARTAAQATTPTTPTAPTTALADPPVLLCIGSDLAIGDSLGPIVGSMLKHKTQGLNVFIYGTLASPITAKEIKYARAFLRETHRGKKVIAIDAAVGEEGDVGLIKVRNSPLYPGAGANKQLGDIGDLSIMGIVAEKSVFNYGLLNATRLNLVYSMAELISEGLSSLMWNLPARQKASL
jgi:putative sporulation protein YyaC